MRTHTHTHAYIYILQYLCFFFITNVHLLLIILYIFLLSFFILQSRRISREKNILNWVKLFTMITTSQSHGRHWKFHINDIKQKAKLGFEHVMAYAETIKDSADLDLDNIRLRSPVYGSDVAGEGGGVDANTELVHHSPNDCVVNYKPVSNEKDNEKCRSVDEDDIEAVCIKESIEEEEDDKGNACNGDWMPESSYENISLSNASEDQSIESTSFLAFQKVSKIFRTGIALLCIERCHF